MRRDVPEPGQLVDIVILAFDRIAAHEPVDLALAVQVIDGCEYVGHGVVRVHQHERERAEPEVGPAAVVVLEVAEQRRYGLTVLAARQVALEQRRSGVLVAHLPFRCVGVVTKHPDVGKAACLHLLEHVVLQWRALAVVDHERMHQRVLGMRCRAVIALLVVLDRELPVGRDVVLLVSRDLEVFEIEQGHGLGQFRPGPLDARRIVGEADENETAEDFEGNADQAILALVEIRGHAARGREIAVDIVHPAVIRAAELARVASVLEADERTAVPADVRKCLEFAVGAAHDDGRFAGHVEDLEVTLLG